MDKKIRKQIIMVDGTGKRMLGKIYTFSSRKEYEEYMEKVLDENGVVRILEKTM